jgi:hypothetical protein
MAQSFSLKQVWGPPLTPPSAPVHATSSAVQVMPEPSL